MCDPAGVHITRIFVNYSRQTPSPIRSTGTVPVCTSTPIINVGLPKPLPKPSPKQQMALLAKEILAQQRCSETFTQKPESPQQPEQFVFISKESGQHIDFKTGDGLGKLNNINTGTVVTKKKKQRETLAIVPPATSARSSKSSDDGDYLVPMNNDIPSTKEKNKANFTSYDGLQKFTFTLDDD